MRLGRWMAVLGCVVVLGLVASVASASIQAPRAIVAASFKLAPPRQGSGFACDGPHGSAQGDAFTSRGTEKDLSSSPHPELAGRLTVRVKMILPSNTSSRYPVSVHLEMTLRDSSGATKYVGSADLAGQVNNSHLSATGLLTATLYAKGKPSSRRLLAAIAITSDDPDGIAPIVGSIGEGSPRLLAIETAAAC